MINKAEEFVELRTSNDPSLYSRAANESAPDQVWKEIIDKYPEMRQWVAHNRTISQSIIVLLAADPDPIVRYFIAMKRTIDNSIREQLAKDPDDSVRLAIAKNKKTPIDILRKLANDSWEEAAKVARERIENSGK
jgi:hypothetical protein